MAIGCVSEYTQELKEQLDEAQKGYQSKYFEETWGELFREELPKVERAIEQRCVECLQENVENARNELSERLVQEGREPTDIEKLDLEVEPTKEEYREIHKLSKEIGMEQLEIIDYPAITGIKDIEMRVNIKDKELEEMGIKGIKGIPHIDMKTMRGLIKETLEFLHTSKIPYGFREQATVNMIVFVDKQEPGSQKGRIAVEKVVKPEVLQKTDPKTLERSRNLYLFQNKEGRLVPRDPKDAKDEKEREKFEEERKDFQWKTAHGIFHINEPKAEGVFKDHFLELERARISQFARGLVTDYAMKGESEFRAEHFAAWVTDSPKLCPEMKEFFDKHFKE